MSEAHLVELPEPVKQVDGLYWYTKHATIAVDTPGKVYLYEPIFEWSYPAEELREVALALLAAAEASETFVPTEGWETE